MKDNDIGRCRNRGRGRGAAAPPTLRAGGGNAPATLTENALYYMAAMLTGQAILFAVAPDLEDEGSVSGHYGNKSN